MFISGIDLKALCYSIRLSVLQYLSQSPCTEVGFDAHLVCGHCDETANAAIHAAGLQKHMRAIGVVHGEGQAVAEGVVHVRLLTGTCIASFWCGQCSLIKSLGEGYSSPFSESLFKADADHWPVQSA